MSPISVMFFIGRMNHFKHSVGAPLHGTEAFPTRQSQIQRFIKEVSQTEFETFIVTALL